MAHFNNRISNIFLEIVTKWQSSVLDIRGWFSMSSLSVFKADRFDGWILKLFLTADVETIVSLVSLGGEGEVKKCVDSLV